MLDDAEIKVWFCREVLPLERQLLQFVRHNWRVEDEVADLIHDIYELAIGAARKGLPVATRPYLFAIARNYLINRTKRARIVSFERIADLEMVEHEEEGFDQERYLSARETLRRVQDALAKLTPRVRQIVQLRKVEGLNVKETAELLGIGSDAVRQQTSTGMRILADQIYGAEPRDGPTPRLPRRLSKGSEG